MQVRFDLLTSSLSTFLSENNYPHHWPEWQLRECLAASIKTDAGELAGAFWFNWDVPDVLEMHVCVRPEFQGRWLNRQIMGDLRHFAVLFNAKQVKAYCPTPFLRRVYLRLGWVVVGDYAHLDIKENSGKTQNENREASKNCTLG